MLGSTQSVDLEQLGSLFETLYLITNKTYKLIARSGLCSSLHLASDLDFSSKLKFIILDPVLNWTLFPN